MTRLGAESFITEQLALIRLLKNLTSTVGKQEIKLELIYFSLFWPEGASLRRNNLMYYTFLTNSI